MTPSLTLRYGHLNEKARCSGDWRKPAAWHGAKFAVRLLLGLSTRSLAVSIADPGCGPASRAELHCDRPAMIRLTDCAVSDLSSGTSLRSRSDQSRTVPEASARECSG